MYVFKFFSIIFFSTLISVEIALVNSHEESGVWRCESDAGARVEAEFRPGIVTLDGRADDWKDVDGFEFSLLPALDPHQENEYKGGKMTVKALHDGKDVFFLLQVDGDYMYSKGVNNRCPSVALMFQVGEKATYHNMGGCKESPDKCNSKTCQGYEVDIMHFSIGNAIPGRLYGGNPIDNGEGNGGDRYGHLVDLYAWNPHCRHLDGMSSSGNDTSAENNWKGTWWHDSLTVNSGFVEQDSPYGSSGKSGTYFFEFSRPLRTADRLQQDVQFTVGQSGKFSAAFWYPVDGKPWHGSGHFSVGCDWIPLDIHSGGSLLSKRGASVSSLDSVTAFTLILSLASFGTSIFVGYLVYRSRSATSFTPVNHL